MNGSFKVHPFFVSLLLTASSGTLAQQVGVPGGGSAPFFDTRNVGSLLGHLEAGTFGALGNGNQWVGIGQPTIAPDSPIKVPANGLRSQWAGQSGIFALKGTGTVKDLAIQWGPDTSSKLSFIFLEDLSTPSSTREVMTVLPNGKVGIGKTNPEFTLDVDGTARVTSVAFDNSLRNTAVGNDALRSNTSGVGNTASGYGALYRNTTGRNNTASGYGVLYRNTTGRNNTASGYEALYRNTTGRNNTASGYQSLYYNRSGRNNTASGYEALYRNTTGRNNTASGVGALYKNTSGDDNTASGYGALFNNTTGSDNTASGYQSLSNNTTGSDNTASGYRSLSNNTTGDDNTASGYRSLSNNSTGGNNTVSGSYSLSANFSGDENAAFGTYSLLAAGGSRNTAIGYGAGAGTNSIRRAIGSIKRAKGNGKRLKGVTTSGSGNVFIGYMAGALETGSDKLYIANSRTSTPLIYGDFAADKVGINTKNFPDTANTADGPVNTSSYSLFVKGGILSESVTIETGWADYVFDDGYTLMPLKQVEAFIAANGHLPNVPSAAKVERQGIEVGNMTRIQQEKIEELTLYIIAQQKKIEAQRSQLTAQGQKVAAQSSQLAAQRSQLTAQEQKVAAQSSQLATQRSQLTAQEQKVAAQQQQLDALNQKVNALLNKP